MTKLKKFTKKELETLSGTEIIDKLHEGDYSLLCSLGCDDLRNEMIMVGKACNSAVNYFFSTTGPKSDPEKHNKAARKKLVKILSKVTPGEYHGFPKDSDKGLVVGFNHPSLGEIARILTMKIDIMGDKPMYFPVNLPWYEVLMPNYEKIKRLGIILTPTITPKLFDRMNLEKDSWQHDVVVRLRKEFRHIYTDLSHEAVKNGGVIFVAPSATRQAKVFKTKAEYDGKETIIPTMSLLAVKLYSDENVKCDFLPMAVLPPTGFKRGLNFRKKYKLIPGKLMTSSYIHKKYFKGKKPPKKIDGFDYDFHMEIAKMLPKDFWY